jgi:hypothetical protein
MTSFYQKSRANKQRGYGVIEVIVAASAAVLVMGLIIGGVIRFFDQQKANRSSNDMRELSEIVAGAFINKASYAGLVDQTLFDADLSPARLTNAAFANASRMRSVFGQPISIGPASVGCAGCNNSFFIEYQDVPTKFCGRVIPQYIQSGVEVFSMGQDELLLVDYTDPFSVPDMIATCSGFNNTFAVRMAFTK